MEHDILLKSLNDTYLGSGYLQVNAAFPEDQRRFVEVLLEVLSHG
jgi:hypothetical protein